MDKVKLLEILTNIERTVKNGQELARAVMDKEPSQRSQNNNWRYVLQFTQEMRKLIEAE